MSLYSSTGRWYFARVSTDDIKKLVAGDVFCMVPWVHLHIPSSGPVRPCCEADYTAESVALGTMKNTQIEEVWNGPGMCSVRKKMMENTANEGCHHCYEMEKTGRKSLRNHYNSLYGHLTEKVLETSEDGVFDGNALTWDLRFSNLCNFSCRMCWHGSSSKWFKDAKVLGTQVAPTALVKSVDDSVQFVSNIEGQMSELESIYFAGGEPLIMEEHYLILKALLRQGLSDTRLSYNTNLSEMEFKGESIVGLWQQFRNVFIGASIDGIGEQGEFVRKGLNWDVFQSNVQLIRKECPHIEIVFSIAVSVFNVLELPNILIRLMEVGNVEPHQIRPHCVQSPAHYRVSLLTEELKSEAKERLLEYAEVVEEWYQRHSDAKLFEYHNKDIQSILSFLDQPTDEEQRSVFQATTKTLDKLRDESFEAVFPELIPLMRPQR